MSLPFMMLLGPFPFSINSAAYQKLQRTTQYNWASQNTLGHPIAKRLGLGGATRQYIGPGDDTINLDGTMYPQYKGGPEYMIAMRLSAGLGIALPLLCSSGIPLGRWIIESVSETKSEFLEDGTARKIEFSLSLKRYQQDYIPAI